MADAGCEFAARPRGLIDPDLPASSLIGAAFGNMSLCVISSLMLIGCFECLILFVNYDLRCCVWFSCDSSLNFVMCSCL